MENTSAILRINVADKFNEMMMNTCISLYKFRKYISEIDFHMYIYNAAFFECQVNSEYKLIIKI